MIINIHIELFKLQIKSSFEDLVFFPFIFVYFHSVKSISFSDIYISL